MFSTWIGSSVTTGLWAGSNIYRSPLDAPVAGRATRQYQHRYLEPNVLVSCVWTTPMVESATEPPTNDAGPSATSRSPAGLGETLREIVRYIPDGTSMPREMWRRRHRNILFLVVAQTPFLLGLGLYEGTESVLTGAAIPATPRWMLAGFLALILTTAALATRSWFPTVIAAFSAMTVSMALVKLSGGYIEAHFHFFVFVAVLALYEDWLPFAVGMGYVAVGHGLFSLIDSSLVYNHPAAIANPIVWGGIHATFITGLALALTVNWYSIEKSREEVDRQLDRVSEQRAEREAVEEARAELEAEKADVEARREEVERLNHHLEATAEAYRTQMRAAADGDLTVRLDAESESEAMTQIAAAFNEMMADIESAMGEIQTFAHEVADAAEQTTTSVDTVSSLSDDLGGSVDAIAEGADEQREMLERVSGEMNTLSAAIEEVASSTETVADAAEQTATIADTGESTARDAIARVRESQSAIESSAEKVKQLDDQMEAIGEIVDLIADIAGQTNLLALNATIEAARAEGRTGSGASSGFAVVADEVKGLAEETADAADEIEAMIDGVQSQTEDTVAEVRTASEHMDAGSSAVEDAVDAFSQVAENAAETDAGVREISDATDDQAASTEETVAMAEEASTISRTTASTAADASTAATEQQTATDEAATQASTLTEHAERLQRLIRAFEVSDGSTASGTAGPSAPALGDGGRPN
jgi:methyl-accepting chemotaxis protein